MLRKGRVAKGDEDDADVDQEVCRGVAHALRHYGDQNSACLLVYKLHSSDPDPVVVSEAADALLSVCPEFATGVP